MFIEMVASVTGGNSCFLCLPDISHYMSLFSVACHFAKVLPFGAEILNTRLLPQDYYYYYFILAKIVQPLLIRRLAKSVMSTYSFILSPSDVKAWNMADGMDFVSRFYLLISVKIWTTCSKVTNLWKTAPHTCSLESF